MLSTLFRYCIHSLGQLQQSTTKWLKTIYIYFLMTPEARSIKSRCWQVIALSKALRRNPSLLLLVSGVVGVLGIPWLTGITLIAAFIFTWSSLCVCVSVSDFPSSYKDDSHTETRAHSNPAWPRFNFITCGSAKILLQNVTGSCGHRFWGTLFNPLHTYPDSKITTSALVQAWILEWLVIHLSISFLKVFSSSICLGPD